MVFIHGVGLRSESWYQQVEALKHDFSVFTIDMPGHGESPRLEDDSPTLNDFTEKVAAFISNEIGTAAVIVGHSMGALLSLSLAKDHPELCLAIVPMNAIFRRSEEAKRAVRERAANLSGLTEADACAPISRWFNDPPSSKDVFHAQLCKEWLMSANLKGYAAAYKIFAKEDGPTTDAISDLNMPVLYMTGELDLNSNVFMTQEMARITPKAEAVIINDSRHMTPLTHAEEVNTALLSFLERRVVNKEIKLI